MNILCAPDSFKETISAVAVAAAMQRGVVRAAGTHHADPCPVADGGEGTLDALVGARGGRILTATVTGPRAERVEARFAVLADGRTGVVELPEASGLALLPPSRRDPTRTTTFGTGELIAAALARGCERVLVTIGGSATCDGGAGLAQALGVVFRDHAGRAIEAPLTGGDLERIASIEKRPRPLPLTVACDVTNPLLGPTGAAAVFAPQKGATPGQVVALERCLAHLAACAGGDPAQPGGGAAGGAGYGLAVLLGARLERGIDLVLDAVDFDARCRQADLVLTGEGRLDGQSRFGKAALGVAEAAARHGRPTIAIVGSTGVGHEACRRESGGPLAGVVDLSARYGEAEALRRPAALIEAAAATVVESRHGETGGSG